MWDCEVCGCKNIAASLTKCPATIYKHELTLVGEQAPEVVTVTATAVVPTPAVDTEGTENE